MRHSNPRRTLALFLVITISVVLASGCSDWERRTFQTLSSSDRVITAASNDYNAGKIPQTGSNYDLILQAQRAQHAAVQSFSSYWAVKSEAEKAFKAGTINGTERQAQVSAGRAAVLQALAELPAVIAAVEAIRPAKEPFPPGTVRESTEYIYDPPGIPAITATRPFRQRVRVGDRVYIQEWERLSWR